MVRKDLDEHSGEFRNSVNSIRGTCFFKSNLIKDWQNGMRHNIPVSATFSLLDADQIAISNLQLSVGIPVESRRPGILCRKERGCGYHKRNSKRIYDYGASISANTKIYGMFVPWKIFGNKVQAIRHVFSRQKSA